MAGADPSPPELPISFAVNNESEEYLIVAAGLGGKLPKDILLGDRIVGVDGSSVTTPTALKTHLRGRTGTADVVLKRGDQKIATTLAFTPETKILDRQYVLADGALIAEDIYPERWDLERFFQVQSVREGSFADRSGWTRYRLIMSIDGVRPTSIEHVNKLLSGDTTKVIIFRGWSAQDTKLHDHHEVEYWPKASVQNIKSVDGRCRSIATRTPN